jgi:mRNA-degrading endonuclease RelE of RelBE toxin-antitoxin system
MRSNIRIVVPAAVADLVRGLHPDLQKKIRAGFETIRDDPHAGKELKDELAGLRSLRVARHRIIYRLGKNERIEIVAVGPREGIYEDTWRKLRAREQGPVHTRTARKHGSPMMGSQRPKG